MLRLPVYANNNNSSSSSSSNGVAKADEGWQRSPTRKSFNIWRFDPLDPTCVQIKLIGKIAFCDASDWDHLKRFKWTAVHNGGNWYARTDRRYCKKFNLQANMHQHLILNQTSIDHIDGKKQLSDNPLNLTWPKACLLLFVFRKRFKQQTVQYS